MKPHRTKPIPAPRLTAWAALVIAVALSIAYLVLLALWRGLR